MAFPRINEEVRKTYRALNEADQRIKRLLPKDIPEDIARRMQFLRKAVLGEALVDAQSLGIWNRVCFTLFQVIRIIENPENDLVEQYELDVASMIREALDQVPSSPAAAA